MSGSTFRGVSLEQDKRFKDKEQKEIDKRSFPANFTEKALTTVNDRTYYMIIIMYIPWEKLWWGLCARIPLCGRDSHVVPWPLSPNAPQSPIVL